MKKILFFGFLLIVSTSSFSQQTATSNQARQNDYLKKSKHQQTVATVLLLSGPVLVIGPLFVSSFSNSEALFYGTIAVGFLTLPASIALFIVSSSTHKKAMRLSFKNESVPQMKYNGISTKFIPSLNLKIRL